jgi:hypothetical protein
MAMPIITHMSINSWQGWRIEHGNIHLTGALEQARQLLDQYITRLYLHKPGLKLLPIPLRLHALP